MEAPQSRDTASEVTSLSCANCSVAKKKGTGMCGRCKSVSYCSVVCQKAHWKAKHKSECKPLVTAADNMLFRVVSEIHLKYDDDGNPDSIKLLSSHRTYEHALKASIVHRNSKSMFDGWDELPFSCDEPPFNSNDLDNYDDDEYCIIRIEDVAAIDAAAQGEIDAALAASKLKKLELAAAKLNVNSGGMSETASPATFGKCNKSFDRADDSIFLRNPSRLASKSVPVSRFPGEGKPGFVDLIRRHNARAHVVKSVGEGHGARYVIRPPGKLVWIAEDDVGLDSNTGNEKIFDTLHTDLIDPTVGMPLLSVKDISRLCTPNVEHMFLNKASETGEVSTKEFEMLADVIRRCKSLKTFVMLEWMQIPAIIFEALATQHETLTGIHLDQCHMSGFSESFPGGVRVAGGTEAEIIKMVKACKKLVWLGLDEIRRPYSSEFFLSLPESIKVLLLDETANNRMAPPRRSVPDAAKIRKRLTNLKISFVLSNETWTTSAI